MVGRARHSVHVAPNLEEEKPPGFFSKRRLSNLFRRASVTSPSALMDTSAALIDTRASASTANLKASFAATSSTSPLLPAAVTAIDREMAFCGAKKYALVTSNGIRATNEDRFRVITSLELFGKALKATEKERIQSYDDALTQRLMESYVNNDNAPAFDAKKLSKSHESADDTEFYGIYDGHGGAKCSSLLALLLPLYLLRQTDFSSSVENAAKRACLEINEEILEREAANQCEGGSTAITLLIRRGIAYFCNTGDCRAIVVSRKGVTALTTDHKATNELEKQRVEAAGGIVLYVHGIPRVNGRLAVARAFGDSELREVVIPLPDVTTHELTPEDEFIILASDGLWDALPNEQVLSCIRNHPWLDINDMAQLLIDRAIELGSMDNVTVLIVDVRKRPPSASASWAGATEARACVVCERTKEARQEATTKAKQTESESESADLPVMADKRRKRKTNATSCFGDSSSSKEDFHAVTVSDPAAAAPAVEQLRKLNQQRRVHLRQEAASAHRDLASRLESDKRRFATERERWESEFESEIEILNRAFRKASAKTVGNAGSGDGGAIRPMTVAGLAVPQALSQIRRDASNYEKRLKTAEPRGSSRREWDFSAMKSQQRGTLESGKCDVFCLEDAKEGDEDEVFEVLTASEDAGDCEFDQHCSEPIASAMTKLTIDELLGEHESLLRRIAQLEKLVGAQQIAANTTTAIELGRI